MGVHRQRGGVSMGSTLTACGRATIDTLHSPRRYTAEVGSPPHLSPPLGRGVNAVKRATLARVQGGKPCWVSVARAKPYPRRAQFF